MARRENTFKKYLVDLMGTRWAVQSHEDSLSEGIADLSFSMYGVNGWIELKQVPKWPVKADTLIKPAHYTPEQVNWIRARGKRGGHCFVFIKVGKEDYYLFTWEHARLIKAGMTKHQYRFYAVAAFEGEPVCPEMLTKALCEN